MHVEIEINDFELVEDPDVSLSNGIQKLFDEISEKGNRTSRFKRNIRIWKHFASETCNEITESIVRCCQFGQNEFNNLSFQFKEKYSEQLNDDSGGAPDIEMGIDRDYDMQRS